MSNIGGSNNNYDPFGAGGDSWYADDTAAEPATSNNDRNDPNSATPPELRDDWSAQLYVSSRPDRPTNLSEADALLNHFSQLNQEDRIDSQTYQHLANAIGAQAQSMRNETPAAARTQNSIVSSAPRADQSTQAAAQRAVARGGSPEEVARQYGISHPADLAILERIESLRKNNSGS
jgi:hypothetical protein